MVEELDMEIRMEALEEFVVQELNKFGTEKKKSWSTRSTKVDSFERKSVKRPIRAIYN